MSADLFGAEDPAPPLRWTERRMLDRIHDRYSKDSGNGPRYVVAEHVRSAAGFGAWNDRDQLAEQGGRLIRTADAIVVDLWPSTGNLVHGIEVKVSRSDWLTELRDPAKSATFRRYCDHWWLAVPDAKIAHDGVPDGWGLLVVGSDGRLRVKRQAPTLTREPMTPGFTASLLRAAVKTATRRTTQETS